MVAVSLFWDTNMAAVTSCENTLLKSNLPDDGHTNWTHRSDAIPKPMKDRERVISSRES